jgi:hypothetical protein
MMNNPTMQAAILAQAMRALGCHDEFIRLAEAEEDRRRFIERLQLEAEVGWESDMLDLLRAYPNLT